MTALAIESLAKRFGSTWAVRDLSLSVGRGQVYGLLGPNGSGKTTTLSCALGLMRPSAGAVTILDQPARRIHRTLGRVGCVFDTATLIGGLSARQNLEYARRLLGHTGGRGIDEALELVELGPLRARRAGALSLGQKKRLAIARALLGRPELLVLDEPLSGLDTLGVRSMLALVRRLAGDGLTLVLSSHRLHEMEQVVTHAGIVLEGSVVREGPLDELLGRALGRYRLSVAPLERARGVLDGLGDVEHACDARGGLTVQLDGRPIGAINRALVGAECDVTAIEPLAATLQSLFEELVDARAAARAHARERA